MVVTRMQLRLLIFSLFIYKLVGGRFRVSTNTDLPGLAFLADGDDIHLSLITEINRIGLNIKLDLKELEVKTATAAILQTIQSWEAYGPFAQDSGLKMEYLSMSSNGLTSTRKMIKNIEKILPYISSSEIYDNKTHTCVVTPRTLSTDKFTRADYNLKKRWSHIDSSWTPATIKSDKSQANTLLLFANYLNDMGFALMQETSELVTILEQLSDEKFPETLHSDLENSECIPEEAGEGYSVKACAKKDIGFCCELETIVPKQLETFTQLYPVHYENIRLKLCENCFYVKDKDSSFIKYANCSARYSMNMDFPVCEFVPLEKECLKYLQEVKVSEVISNCKFEEKIPDTVTLLPKNGILVQGKDDISVSTGTRTLSERLPYVIYSPDSVIVRHNGQEITVPGSKSVTALQIAISILTDDDILTLKKKHFWDDFRQEWGTDDSLRVSLLSLQILFVPISIGLSVFLFIRNKAKLAILEQAEKQAATKANYEENRKMLKPRRK